MFHICVIKNLCNLNLLQYPVIHVTIPLYTWSSHNQSLCKQIIAIIKSKSLVLCHRILMNSSSRYLQGLWCENDSEKGVHYTVISFLTDIAHICFFLIKPRENYCYYKPLIKPLGCLFSNFLDGGLIREGVLIERGTYLKIKIKCLYFKVKYLYLYWITLSTT